MTILDVQNRVVLASTPMGRAPAALALTPDERFLAVADEGTATLAVLIADPVRLAKVRSALVTTIPVGAGPVSVGRAGLARPCGRPKVRPLGVDHLCGLPVISSAHFSLSTAHLSRRVDNSSTPT